MADEQYVSAQLFMDRSTPLGNSEDTFSRRALHTKVGNKADEPVPVEFKDATQPLITNLLCAAAGTEYSHAFQPYVKKFTIRARNRSELRFAYIAGDTNTTYFTIPSGAWASEDQIKPQALTMYFQTSKNNEIIEITEWK